MAVMQAMNVISKARGGVMPLALMAAGPMGNVANEGTSIIKNITSGFESSMGGTVDFLEKMILGTTFSNDTTAAGTAGSLVHDIGGAALIKNFGSKIPGLGVAFAGLQGFQGLRELFRGDFLDATCNFATAAVMWNPVTSMLAGPIKGLFAKTKKSKKVSKLRKTVKLAKANNAGASKIKTLNNRLKYAHQVRKAEKMQAWQAMGQKFSPIYQKGAGYIQSFKSGLSSNKLAQSIT